MKVNPSKDNDGIDELKSRSTSEFQSQFGHRQNRASLVSDSEETFDEPSSRFPSYASYQGIFIPQTAPVLLPYTILQPPYLSSQNQIILLAKLIITEKIFIQPSRKPSSNPIQAQSITLTPTAWDSPSLHSMVQPASTV
jgi:hypothetical protein